MALFHLLFICLFSKFIIVQTHLIAGYNIIVKYLSQHILSSFNTLLFRIFSNYYTEKLVTLCEYLLYNPS